MPRPRLTHLEEVVVDELGRADVETAGRLSGEQHDRLMRQFARQQDLLQVAA